MNPVYLETHFRVPNGVRRWPVKFVILSAFATTGETWTEDQNAAADHALDLELRARAKWQQRVVGYSPSSGHAEESWATDLPLDEARSLARQFKQDAIYVVDNDQLMVTDASPNAPLFQVGSFRSRLDARE